MSYGRYPYYIIRTKGWPPENTHPDQAKGEYWPVIQFINPIGLVQRGEFDFPLCYGSSREDGHGASIPEAAMGQFIASLSSRGSKALQEFIDIGVKMRLENEAHMRSKGFNSKQHEEDYFEEKWQMRQKVIVFRYPNWCINLALKLFRLKRRLKGYSWLKQMKNT